MIEFDEIFYLKIISIPSLFLLCFVFGIIPYVISRCRMNESFLSYANTFSGGLFFGIGEFHLLAEGTEKLQKYSDLPISFFLAFCGYSLILFIQKVIFGYIVPGSEENLKEKEESHKKVEEDNLIEEHEKTEGDITMTKLPLLNSKEEDFVALQINASTRTTVDEKIEQKKLNQKKLSSFIMLLALSIHGIFECLALWIQTDFKKSLFLFIALMIHKWAEAFSLGIFFIQARIIRKYFYLLIIFFSLIGPIGVSLGIILSANASEFIEGTFLSISTGTFLYVACSEVIVEEFSTPINRYIKFLLYLLGGAFAAGLASFEYFF